MGVGITTTPIQRNDSVQRPQLGTGIISGFTIAQTAGALVPTVTTGDILTPKGRYTLRSGDIPSAVDSATRFYYFNVDTELVEIKSTNVPTNTYDIYLGALTAASGAISEYWSGQWLDPRVIRLAKAADLTATGGTYLATIPYVGAPKYVYELEVRVTTTATGSGTITFEKHAAATATATALGTVTVGAVTASQSAFSGRKKLVLATPIAINHGDYIAAKTGTAASAGNGDLNVLIGGSQIVA